MVFDRFELATFDGLFAICSCLTCLVCWCWVFAYCWLYFGLIAFVIVLACSVVLFVGCLVDLDSGYVCLFCDLLCVFCYFGLFVIFAELDIGTLNSLLFGCVVGKYFVLDCGFEFLFVWFCLLSFCFVLLGILAVYLTFVLTCYVNLCFSCFAFGLCWLIMVCVYFVFLLAYLVCSWLL